MRIFAAIALLTLFCVAARAAEFVDKPTGLKLAVPDGLNRDSAREKGAVKFAGRLVAGGKYVHFTVEAVSASNFDADKWLANERKSKGRYIADGSVTQPFTADKKRKIGGLDAVGYVFGGKPKAGNAGDVRFRVYGVVHDYHFFQITEVSVDGGHEVAAEVLGELWDGISFQEGDDGGAGADAGAKGLKPASGDPKPVEDKAGNYKTTLPPGWEVAREAPADEESAQRMAFIRKDDAGNNLAVVEVWRFQFNNARIFHSGTPNEAIQILKKQRKFWEVFYGEGSNQYLRIEVDEGVGFGEAQKTGGYEVRAKTVDELKKIADAETAIRKGEKNVTMPKFLDKVLRGRVAMISPHVYITRCTFRRTFSDDPQLLAEYKKIHDDLKFLASEAAPPPLQIQGNAVGNTVKDPANAKARKEKFTKDVSRKKTYRIEWQLELPPGWVLKKSTGGDGTFLAYVQDERNNWVRISVANVYTRDGNYDPDSIFETWRSNWTAKARGDEDPKKLDKFKLGKVRGKGFKTMEGKVNGFHATFTAMFSEKFPGKGWWTVVEVETRGRGHEVFADSLKKFLKSWKSKDIKVK